jgi:hypothetical protein
LQTIYADFVDQAKVAHLDVALNDQINWQIPCKAIYRDFGEVVIVNLRNADLAVLIRASACLLFGLPTIRPEYQ